MKSDTVRIKSYLAEIRRNALDLCSLINQNELTPDSIPLKAAKYILIELDAKKPQTLPAETETFKKDLCSLMKDQMSTFQERPYFKLRIDNAPR